MIRPGEALNRKGMQAGWKACTCRTCRKCYWEHKSTADYKGYCSQKCQHEKARQLGWRPKGPAWQDRGEYQILSRNKQLGSVPYSATGGM